MTLGDSRVALGGFQPLLSASLLAAGMWNPVIGNYGVHGQGLQYTGAVPVVTSTIDATLAAMPITPEPPPYVLLNWGRNDDCCATADGGAEWRARYLAVLDKIHAKWPAAKVYLMYPWSRGLDAFAASLHGYIDMVIGSRAFAFAGPDEAVWLKGADNGATMTYDGVHYSAAGDAECAAQWLTVLGY